MGRLVARFHFGYVFLRLRPGRLGGSRSRTPFGARRSVPTRNQRHSLVLSLGATATKEAASGTMSVALTIQDANNYVVVGLGANSYFGYNTTNGTLRQAGGLTQTSGRNYVEMVLGDNTAATATSVACSSIFGRAPWAVPALVLR